MSEQVAHIIYHVLALAFGMAADEPELHQCGAENKPVAALLPADLRKALVAVYEERRNYLRETTP
jgi:hypothetical protein